MLSLIAASAYFLLIHFGVSGTRLRDELVARLQAHYGFSKNEAQREVDAWVKTQRYAA